MNTVHKLTPNFCTSIAKVSASELRTELRCGVFPSGLPTEHFYAFLIFHKRATYSALLDLLYLIALIFGEKYKSWSFSWSNCLHLPITSSLLRPKNNLPFFYQSSKIRGRIQKFPDWVDNEINAYNNKHTLRRKTKSYDGKTH